MAVWALGEPRGWRSPCSGPLVWTCSSDRIEGVVVAPCSASLVWACARRLDHRNDQALCRRNLTGTVTADGLCPDLDAGNADNGVFLARRKAYRLCPGPPLSRVDHAGRQNLVLRKARRFCPSPPLPRVDHAGRQDLQRAEEAGEVRDRM